MNPIESVDKYRYIIVLDIRTNEEIWWYDAKWKDLLDLTADESVEVLSGNMLEVPSEDIS